MAVGGSISNLGHLLKKVYSTREVENAVYKDNPLFALMRKSGGFTGESHIHMVRYRDPLARSPTFATAQTARDTAAGASKGKQFVMTRVKDYSTYSIAVEAMLATRDDKGAFLKALTDEVDGTLNQAGRSMGIKLYQDGCGVLATNITVASLVFTVGESVTNFEEGMTIVGSVANDLGALRGTTACVVTIVNRDAGTITVSDNTTGGTIATGDSLHLSGDRQDGAITTFAQRLNIAGLEAWNPVTAPVLTTDSFFGVDRGSDPSRLAGLRLDISALTPEEGLVTALHKLAREGGDPSHIFMNFGDAKNIVLALGSKVENEYTQVGDIGFEAVRIRGPKGSVRIYSDQNAPPAVARILTLDTWEIKHLADLFNFIDQDGARLSRLSDQDGFEGRINFYGNVVNHAPGKNMRCVLPS